MKRFDYDISVHPADSFNKLAYFCSATGECALNEVPSDHLTALLDILNERGERGWELVQLAFGKEGVIAFWKREAPGRISAPEIAKA
jgi:hypothetical protein